VAIQIIQSFITRARSWCSESLHLIWLTSRLLWKSVGIYLLLSFPALLLVLAGSGLADTDGAQHFHSLAVKALLTMWLAGAICVPVMVTILLTPLQRLVQALQSRDDTLERRQTLANLRHRRDLFGEAAIALGQLDNERTNYFRDVTRRDQEAQASSKQLAAVLQAMVEGVLAVDGQDRVVFANSAACRMLELNAASVGGRLIFECVRSSHVHDAFNEAVRQQEAVGLEFRLSRMDILVKLTASPVAGGGAVLVIEDVTGVRKLETMRRDFVNGVSHELKTPLTVIQACTETLLDGAIDDTDAAKHFLGQIQQQSERLLQMILGMLQLARVESGQQVLDSEPVDLCDIVRHIVAEIHPVAEGSQRILEMLGADELYVLGDYQAIRTVVGNLVDNALKYTKEGGKVSVTLTAGDEANVITISDDGIGIPPQEQPRVFERFYRVQRDRNRDRGGTGLGLAIVKHLCEAMGAAVSLESHPGKGSTFQIRFPFDD